MKWTNRTEVRLIGLSKPNSMTCTPLNSSNIFWIKGQLNKDRFRALFDYCKNDWGNEKIIIIEHSGIRSDGTPVNPKFIEIKNT